MKIRETDIFKKLRGGNRIQILRHFQTTEQLKKAFGKDGRNILALPNIGLRSYNILCQILKKYDCIKYDVVRGICQVCGSDIIPHRNQREDGTWQYGYLCDCSEKTRGKKAIKL